MIQKEYFIQIDNAPIFVSFRLSSYTINRQRICICMIQTEYFIQIDNAPIFV